MIDDQQIVEGCLRHDRKAQKLLFDTYSGMMLGWCMRYVSNSAEAEDLMQDALVRAYFNIHEYSGKGSLAAWLRKIAVNVAITRFTSNQKHQQEVELEDYQVAETIYADSAEHEFTSEELFKVLNELPPRFRMVFNLYAIEGYKHKEIAKMLDIDVGTSKSHYSRAKGMIKEKLIALAGGVG